MKTHIQEALSSFSFDFSPFKGKKVKYCFFYSRMIDGVIIGGIILDISEAKEKMLWSSD